MRTNIKSIIALLLVAGTALIGLSSPASAATVGTCQWSAPQRTSWGMEGTLSAGPIVHPTAVDGVVIWCDIYVDDVWQYHYVDGGETPFVGKYDPAPASVSFNGNPVISMCTSSVDLTTKVVYSHGCQSINY